MERITVSFSEEAYEKIARCADSKQNSGYVLNKFSSKTIRKLNQKSNRKIAVTVTKIYRKKNFSLARKCLILYDYYFPFIMPSILCVSDKM